MKESQESDAPAMQEDHPERHSYDDNKSEHKSDSKSDYLVGGVNIKQPSAGAIALGIEPPIPPQPSSLLSEPVFFPQNAAPVFKSLQKLEPKVEKSEINIITAPHIDPIRLPLPQSYRPSGIHPGQSEVVGLEVRDME